MAGGRSLRVDRLAAVVAHQLQPAHHPRVRAAEHVERRHGGRSIAVDALRHRRRADRDRRSRGPWRRSGCRRCSSRTRSGWSRSITSSRSCRGCGRASARARSFTASTPTSTARACRICGTPATSAPRSAASCARRRWCRSSRTFSSTTSMSLVRELAHLNSLHDVFLAHRRRVVRVRAARRVGRLDRGVRRRERAVARDVAARAGADGRPRARVAGDVSRGRRSRRGSTRCG